VTKRGRNTSWQILEVRIDSDTNPHKQFVWDPENRDYIDAPAEAHGARR